MHSDCLRTLWSISHEQKFSQIWDLCRNTANNIKFHHIKNSVKMNDWIFQWIEKNLVFGPILVHFPKYWGKKIIFQNLSGTTSYGFLAPYQNSEKTNDTIPRKGPDRRTDRPYFIEPFRLSPGVQKGLGTSFQVTFFIKYFDKKFSFVILHKLVKFHYQTMFTCWGIWWRHDIWISEKSKFDYIKSEKSFQIEI